MLKALMETEQTAATVVVFVGTFVIALSIGRLLKRRAAVRLGILYQLFCLTIAFYAALSVYGVQADWRKHVGAVSVLFSTALVVALVNRYVFDWYFEQQKKTTIPHFLREIVAMLIFLIALMFVLSVGYHAERELKGILAGSGIAAIILGFAGQNLFGSIIAGMSLQINRPYKLGDWLKVGDVYGEVMEINWRSTRLCTNDDIYLDIPNNEIIKSTIVNLHYPTEVHAMRIRIGIDYHVPPNRVKDALIRAAQSAKNVLPQPPVRVFLVDFADHAVVYEIKYYMGNHQRINETNDSIRTNVWYELKRQRIRIPYPIRTLEIERHGTRSIEQEHDEARTILRNDALFSCLTDDQIDRMVKNARLNHFGIGERMVSEGDAGDSMFVLLRGAAQVTVAQNGTTVPVATLSSGDCFGEMSLLTGEPRSATVRADRDCYVMEIGKPVMAGIIHESPECLQQLSEILAARKLNTEVVLKDTARPADHAAKEDEYRSAFMTRLRTFFSL